MYNLNLPFESMEEDVAEITRTYAIDWESGRIIGYVDALEAVKQYIKKVLMTPRFRCLIYDNQYGNEVCNITINKNTTKSYLETEIPFLIADALTDKRILKIENVYFEYGKEHLMLDSILIKFDVETVYGNTQIKEVI